MVFLQTSCSKEQSENSLSAPARKSAPVTLNHTHQDVLDFKTQYNLFINSEITNYPSLSISDAELILEASFNFDHQIQNLALSNYEVVLDSAIDVPFTSSTYSGNPIITSNELFSIYDDLLGISIDSNIAPMSDIEIVLNGSTDDLVKISLGKIKLLDFDTKIPYVGDYLAYGCQEYIKGSPHWCLAGSPSYCIPVQSPGESWKVLDRNLRVDYASPYLITTGNSGYYYSVKHLDYGEDPFNINGNSYEGPLGQDYSLLIHGVHNTVNPSTLADGWYNQCIDNQQISDYEQNMIQIISDNTLLSAREVFSLKVEGKESDNDDGSIEDWTHHRFQFSTGILRNP